jgi:hypothetical protein
MEFPKFDGDNSMRWLRQVEKCFTLADTPMDKRVIFVEAFFTRKADHWLRSSGINTNSISWVEFAILISNIFDVESNFEIVDNFRHMEQTSIVNAYIDAFEELMSKVKIHTPSVTKYYFIGCFLSGLKEHIKIPLRSHNPRTLVQAYSLARNYDITIQKKHISKSLRWNSKPPYAGRTTSVFQNKDPPDDKQNTANKWEKGKCYKCQEPWVTGHNRVCKFKSRIHLIAIEDDGNGDSDTEDPQPDTQTTSDDNSLEL